MVRTGLPVGDGDVLGVGDGLGEGSAYAGAPPRLPASSAVVAAAAIQVAIRRIDPSPRAVSQAVEQVRATAEEPERALQITVWQLQRGGLETEAGRRERYRRPSCHRRPAPEVRGRGP
ncbi:hypothetical protein GCM10022197_03950 [Microlunatus spumicola]|uniref:Uncharacterized protein n=1 Tax=Microlunatus spumicola TaxID=81499 RepID=A0ABP6WME6_9ACTN